MNNTVQNLIYGTANGVIIMLLIMIVATYMAGNMAVIETTGTWILLGLSIGIALFTKE